MLLKTQLIYLRTLKHYNRFLVGLWIARQVTIQPIQESVGVNDSQCEPQTIQLFLS